MPDQSDSSIAERFAAFAAGLDPAAVPDEALEAAKHCLLDALGIALAASTFDFAHTALAGAQAMGGAGASPVIGFGRRLPLRDALLVNGVLVHGLDYDDTHGASVVHCSASALPLMLGAGLAAGADGRRALAAYLLAVEVDARLGAVAEGSLQKRGWHPTGVMGAFGCAAAAGFLARADARAIAHALGITLSMASGNLEFLADGAWTKRLHPGWAAVCGYTAATLAQAGFVGPAAPFEGRFGLYRMLLGAEAKPDPARLTASLGRSWEIFDVAIKPFPACHYLHAAADAALALRAEPGFAPADVESIRVLLHADEIPIVGEPQAAKRRPRNAYEAQFSVHYAVAACLVRGRLGLAELDAEALEDPAIRALAARVSCEPDPASDYPRHYSGAVEILFSDGRRRAHREQINRGSRARPLPPADVEAKFFDNALRATDRPAAERLRRAVLALDSAPDLRALAAAACLE